MPPHPPGKGCNMVRFAVFLALFIIAYPAQAQVMRQETLVCDLYINDFRVSWPANSMSERECSVISAGLEKEDQTDANITCVCKVGARI